LYDISQSYCIVPAFCAWAYIGVYDITFLFCHVAAESPFILDM